MNLKIFLIYYFVQNISKVSGNLEVKGSTRLLDLNLFEDAIDFETCEQQIDYMSSENTFLRYQFLDAGIRFPRGFFAGNTIDFGNYYQCLGLRQELENTIIEGKYCMISVQLRQNSEGTRLLEPPWIEFDSTTIQDVEKNYMHQKYKKFKNCVQAFVGQTSDESDSEEYAELLRAAICIPKPCTTQKAFEEALPFNLSFFGVSHQHLFCRLPNDKQWIAADYVAVSIFSIIGVLTVLSTAYDLYKKKLQSKDPVESNELLSSFSVFTNAQRLMTFKSDSDSLESVDGVRSLAMMWIIIGHSFVVPTAALPMANFFDTFVWATSFKSLWITSAPICVDTFFFLSGLLVVYTTANKLSSMKLVKNIHLFYLNRLLRMFPLLATTILLEVSIFKHVVDGPYFTNIAWRAENCRNNWWSALLYLQNYINPSGMCLGHSWYLDVDMQLHLIVPLVLFFVFYGKQTAWISLATAMLVSLISATAYNFSMNFPGGSFVPSRFEDSALYARKYYYNTLTRAPPFFVGLLFGYLLHTCRGRSFKIPKFLVLLFWTSSAILSAWVISYNYFIMQDDWSNQLVDNLMNSFMRPIWAMCVGWIIFACTKGYGGPVNWFLSHGVWKLPARISYGMYLFHYSLIYVISASSLQPYYFTVPFLIFQFLADYTIAFMMSFMATVLIDAPFSKIFKLVLGGGIKKPKRPDSDKRSS